ncbi:MAG: peptidase M23 [Kordiimonadales bacterium]|nr:MAG: peptidase M23 [Kordiimonadales bacterium]
MFLSKTTALAFAVLFSALAVEQSRASQSPEFLSPLACNLGEDCWIARYADRGEKDDKRLDYTCGRRTQEGHKGTDFVIADRGRMQRGVDVVAVAAGKVLRVRTTMTDNIVGKIDAEAIKGRFCGNAVVMAHADGYETQYCHMKQGSVTVKPGDEITAGRKIGEVGMSGFTEYPHVHLNVRRDGEMVDPFDGNSNKTACDATADGSLWRVQPKYKDTTLLPLTFLAAKPTKASRWEPQQQAISAQAPALILSARAFNARKGDRWLFKIYRPDGTLFIDYGVAQKKGRQIAVQFAGKKRPKKGGFQKGEWRGTVLIARDRPNGKISKFRGEITVTVVD